MLRMAQGRTDAASQLDRIDARRVDVIAVQQDAPYDYRRM